MGRMPTCSPARRSASTRATSASAPPWTRCSRSRSAQHRRAQHGARHRAQRAASRRRPLHDLRLEHLLGLAHQARHQGNLSRAHLRPAGRRRQGPQARPQHPRRRARRHPQPAAEDQQRRPQEARRIPGIRPRYREAHRPRRQGGAPRRLAAHARSSPTCRVRPTRSRRIRRTT